MRHGFWIALASLAAVTGFAGCGTLGKHYDESTEADVAAPAGLMATISVETKPTGAMISLNGSEVGTSPTNVRVEVDRSGLIIGSVEISADFGVIAPVRGVSHIVTAKYKNNDPAPRLLILARPADGGIQSLGNILLRR
jgi:hypothetical protein